MSSTRCVVKSFDTTGVACTSSAVDGLAVFVAAVFAFVPIFKQMSPRAALMELILHTLFVAMIGLSVAWLRGKGLQLSKRRFTVRKNLEQRAERNMGLLGALIPRSVHVKMEEAASSGEALKAWTLPHITWIGRRLHEKTEEAASSGEALKARTLPHITMLCVKFTPSVSELSMDPETAQSVVKLLDDRLIV
ncbi:hypothetical protein T484DRAFT_1782446 [Baffinella frigidus]|nr:hypothetical protein T484DRAFT_1782446 [Cryptophyta sp. CCMP2293]